MEPLRCAAHADVLLWLLFQCSFRLMVGEGGVSISHPEVSRVDVCIMSHSFIHVCLSLRVEQFQVIAARVVVSCHHGNQTLTNNKLNAAHSARIMTRYLLPFDDLHFVLQGPSCCLSDSTCRDEHERRCLVTLRSMDEDGFMCPSEMIKHEAFLDSLQT